MKIRNSILLYFFILVVSFVIFFGLVFLLDYFYHDELKHFFLKDELDHLNNISNKNKVLKTKLEELQQRYNPKK
jgi:hypothetical protein